MGRETFARSCAPVVSGEKLGVYFHCDPWGACFVYTTLASITVLYALACLASPTVDQDHLSPRLVVSPLPVVPFAFFTRNEPPSVWGMVHAQSYIP